MKILHIAPQAPRKNGIVDYADHYRSLINKYTEHKIDLFTYDKNVTHCEANIAQLKSLFKISHKLAAQLSENRYDIIHAEIGSTCYPEFYLLLFLSFQKTSVPIVITFHDPPHLILDPIKFIGLSSSALLSRAIKRVCSILFSNIMEKRVLTKSSIVFVLSAVGQKVACRRFKKQCDIIVPLKHFIFNENGKNTHSFKKENIILSAGFWTPRRGIEILLNALCLLREKSPEVVKKWKIFISGGILDDTNSKGYYQYISNMIQKGNWGDTIEIKTDLPICSFDNLFNRAAIYVSSDIQPVVTC
jgi:glycosyltransferase involved in cell wall biosynthesis